ncbi:MAG: hypothetical protein LUG99_23300 [Lachnospiraceae bacterium]|nr:hypothetical protein [Lachnospiraceae bacterium]
MAKITRFNIITKTCFQIFLYALEIFVFCGFLTYLSLKLIPLEPAASVIDILERFTLFYALYQITVYLILTNINDVKADEYLALHSTAELATLAVESHSTQLVLQVKNTINKQLDGGILNDIKVRANYAALTNCIESENAVGIKQISIWSSHCVEESKLNWKFSFLLRIFK